MKLKTRKNMLTISHRPTAGIILFVLLAIAAIASGAYLYAAESETEAGIGVGVLGVVLLLVPMVMTKVVICFDRSKGTGSRVWQALGGFRKKNLSLKLDDIAAIIYRTEERRNKRNQRYCRWSLVITLKDGREAPFYPTSHPCPFPKIGEQVAAFLEIPFRKEDDIDSTTSVFEKRDTI